MSSSPLTFHASNGSLTTATRKLINFVCSRKKQDIAAKKITSTIVKLTVLSTRAKRLSSTPSKFPLYTITAAAAAANADCNDTDALCSTLLHDGTRFEMLSYKDVRACTRFKKNARAPCCCPSLLASCTTAPCLCF